MKLKVVMAHLLKEMELTKVIDKLKKHFYPKIQIKNTYMAAHAVPKEYKSSKEFMRCSSYSTFKRVI